MVVELDVDPDELRRPETTDRQPYQLGSSFELARDRLQFLVWTNSYDARGDDLVWWHGRRAARLGATPGGPADVVLPDGRPAWCDGGPSQVFEPDAARALGGAVVHRWSIEAGSLVPAGPRAGPSPAWPDRPLAQLAPDQQAAVVHARGPARVIAPAGSGKTSVLTARLRHLLLDRGIDPSVVTAVAFNRRAADEMVERTADLRAAGLRPHIRTIHSLALAIVNGLGASPRRADRRVIEERAARRILEAITEIRPQANTDVLAPYLEGLAMIRIGLVDPARAEAALPDATGLHQVFRRYRDVLDRDGVVDFDEQVYRAIVVLVTEPEVRHRAQALGRHLLVDEVQDLAPAHLLLLRLVATPVLDCFGVGDDDQVIYGYAGADPDHLISFHRWFPGAAAHALEVNYRCPPAVVAAASNLVTHNRRRIAKVIRAAPGRQGGSRDLVVRRLAGEAMGPAVVDQIQSWRREGSALADMVVLARVNAALLGPQVCLVAAGIACSAPLDARILERTGVRTALAYLRIAVEPSHISRGDLSETIRRPSRRIARNVVEMLTKRPTGSVADIRSLARHLSGGDVAKLSSYADDLAGLSRVAPRGTLALLRAVRETVGLGQAMDSLDGSREAVDRSSHGDDLAALEQAAALHPDPGTFEEWLRSLLDPGPSGHPGPSGDRDPGGDVVELSTVHRVKGQEWSRVLVVGAHDELFPHRLAHDREEERRVFHVAITRAVTSVVVLADDQRPSPFVAELDHPGHPASGEPEPSRRRPAERKGGAPQRSAPRPAPGSVAAEEGPVALALRAWRREQCGRDRVPAYVVLSDDHLRGIAARRPSSMAELAGCPGMGPIRLQRYGDDILAVIEAAAQERS